MLEADEAYFKEYNKDACKKYLKRIVPIKIWLEMKIDITGVEISRLYTQPEDIWDIHRELSIISPLFSNAAAFGNVKEKVNSTDNKLIFLVFHDGSSSTKDEIKTTVKMNIRKEF
ncbi:unnamed protein product [Adineta steineri]|uniref:fructose-bisphosphate aldolase n=1 Tax=Adineta steineri TaxID=433720 RepID=A0A818PJ13_9BILA|nr:unnamed protein product [Adineta steineri]CAF3621941.1 unnamed protein product [Adineta steineri]